MCLFFKLSSRLIHKGGVVKQCHLKASGVNLLVNYGFFLPLSVWVPFACGFELAVKHYCGTTFFAKVEQQSFSFQVFIGDIKVLTSYFSFSQ